MDAHVLFADISSNDARFNAHAYKSAGHKVIAIKATEDARYVNPLYAAWAHAAHAAGLGVLHYHFARPEHGNPIGQATHFHRTVKPHWIKGRDRLVVDQETGTPGEAHLWLQEFETQLAHLGADVNDELVGYTYKSFFEQSGVALKSGAWWLASWGPLLREREALGRGQYLWSQQYTDGRAGPEPHLFAGVIGPGPGGASDGSVLNKRSLSLIEKALGGKQ